MDSIPAAASTPERVGERPRGRANRPPAGALPIGRVLKLDPARRASRIAADVTGEIVERPARGAEHSSSTSLTSLGAVGVLIRAPGGGAMLTESAFAALAPSARAAQHALRGAIHIAGPPAHRLGEMSFDDLPSAVGAIWRTAVAISEPGVCTEVALEHPAGVLAFSHAARAITVLALDANGELLSRRRYDPFALLEGLVGACARFERMLRACDLGAASRTVLQQFSRPAFPRVLPRGDGPA